MRKFTAKFACGLLVLAASPAFAQPVIVADSGDSAWVLAASLVILAAGLPGLWLTYGTATRTNAVLPVAVALGTLVFVAIGYSLAFGEGSPVLGGSGNAFLANLADLRDGTTISDAVFVVFQLAIALFALTIVTASLAPAARPGWLIPFSGLWLLIVYVPVARWAGSGWLTDLGAIDVAGGLTVQASAGTAALVGSLLLGRKRTTAPSPPVTSAIGPMLIAAGWLAVLGGSALGAGDDAATALLNGLTAAASGSLVALLVRIRRDDAFETGHALVGALAGLAATSACAGLVGIGGAVALGAIGAIAALASAALLGRTGSPMSAFPLHGAGGIAGAVAYPFFVLPALGGPGFAEGGSLVTQLAAQGVATLAVLLWTIVATVIAALSVSALVPMRAGASAG